MPPMSSQVAKLMVILRPDIVDSYVALLDETYAASSWTAFVLLDRERKRNRLMVVHLLYSNSDRRFF